MMTATVTMAMTVKNEMDESVTKTLCARVSLKKEDILSA
jgi:hypothetical protein